MTAVERYLAPQSVQDATKALADGNVSIRVHWGPDRKFVVVAVAHSIFNRTCKTNVGELMSRYGGGGHRGAGSTPIPKDVADEKVRELLDELREDDS